VPVLKREIIYPFFLECCAFASDAFWENIFEELAYGKSPQGTYISKDCLCCGYKGKEFAYRIERKDAEILYNEVSGLLVNKLGILSQKEKEQKRIVFHELEKNIQESKQEWSQIRKKNIKDTIYEIYVIDMKKKYGLSFKQCKHLLAVIFLANTFKTITTKDIHYENDKIQSIQGIDFEDGKVLFTRPLYTVSSKVTEQDYTAENCKILSENWTKYLESLEWMCD